MPSSTHIPSDSALLQELLWEWNHINWIYLREALRPRCWG